MKSLFNKYRIEVRNDQLEKFEKYYTLLIEFNQKFNITAITEKEEVYKKHFIDSILGTCLLTGKKILDIGAGGGFPSIPLKIINSEKSFTLIDATEKKCDFLRHVIKELDLKDCKVICGRAEELAKDNLYREKFDCVVSRAVARLNILCEYCIPFIKLNGNFIAYKGDAEEELTEAKNAIKILGCKIKEIKNFDLEGAKRTIIDIEKIFNTEKKYPRANGRIKKNPL